MLGQCVRVADHEGYHQFRPDLIRDNWRYNDLHPQDDIVPNDDIEKCLDCGHAVDDHDRRAEDGECFVCTRLLVEQPDAAPCADTGGLEYIGSPQ
jgi:hypothetical protein